MLDCNGVMIDQYHKLNMGCAMADDYKKHQGDNHQASDNQAPYPVSRLAPSIELVDLAQQIAHADNMLTTQTEGKLRVIAEQIRRLQEAAKDVLEEAQQAQQLHRAKCNFKRIPGKTYHLYQQTNGELMFSMLSPREWGGTPPHQFLGSYRLENDMSWKEVDESSSPTHQEQELERLLLQLRNKD